MLGDRRLVRIRQAFAEQFAVEGGRLVYRKSLRGPPIVVSEAERDLFIQAFDLRLRRLYRGLLVGMIALLAAMAVLSVMIDDRLSNALAYGMMIVPLGIAAPFWIQAWNAPARELAGRPSYGELVDPDVLRRRGLRRLTWGQLLLALLAPALLVWRLGHDYDLMYGWNRLWLVGAGTLMILVAAQAARKWRADQDRAP